MDIERILLYWINEHPKNDSWIILNNIKNMINHNDRTLHGTGDLKDTLELNIKYIYLSKCSDNRVTTILCDDLYYYLIDNQVNAASDAEQQQDIKSNIWYNKSIVDLIDMIPADLCKYINIKSIDKIIAHLSNSDKKKLESVLPLDFARTTDPVTLWRSFIESKSNTLDMSNLYAFSPRTIIEAGVKIENIKTLILNQNILFAESLSWLFYFKGLETLTLWNINLSDEDLTNIHKYAPELSILEFHHCQNITGRALLPLNKLTKLDKLVINNQECKLQNFTYETIITDEEWKSLKGTNTSVTSLLIDSANLTLDFIDFALKTYTSLNSFIMHDKVLEKLEKNSRNGHSDRKINFHSIENLSKGFSRQAEVKVMDLVRNKVGPAFSQSMLRKIKELDPSKADIVEMLV